MAGHSNLMRGLIDRFAFSDLIDAISQIRRGVILKKFKGRFRKYILLYIWHTMFTGEIGLSLMVN